MIAPTLKSLDPGRQYEMHCFDYKSSVSQTLPKYTLWVVDSDDVVLKNQSPNIAALICPQGKERESLFSTELGRQNLCKQAKVSRIVIVLLGHGHVFESLDIVKDELNAKILELAPDFCSNMN